MDRASVEEHYQSQWGPPDLAEEFSSGPLRLWLYKWAMSERTRGVTIYATYGVSSHHDVHGRGAEVLVGLTPAQDQILPAIADLGATIVERGVDVDHGSTWKMAGPLWDGTQMDFFLTIHQHSTIQPLVGEAVRIEFFNAVPIFGYEAELKKVQGLDALKQWWRQQQIRFWDPSRSPVEAQTTNGGESR